MIWAVDESICTQKYAIIEIGAGGYNRWGIDLTCIVESFHLNMRRIFDIKMQAIGGSRATRIVEFNHHGISCAHATY